MASFGTMVLYQLIVLLPLCLITMVNLNFALCHSPADPFFDYVGYHYFTGGVIVLNLFSTVSRWLSYLMVLPLKIYFDNRVKKINGQEIEKNGNYNLNGNNGTNGNHVNHVNDMNHENNCTNGIKKSKSPKR